MSSQGLQCPEETDASAPSASKQRIGAWGMSPRPEATRVRSGSQSVSTAYRGGGLLCRSERQQGQHPSVSGSSGFHHSDERHRLRAGGLGYPDTAQVLRLGTGLRAEVPMTDLLLY